MSSFSVKVNDQPVRAAIAQLLARSLPPRCATPQAAVHPFGDIFKNGT